MGSLGFSSHVTRVTRGLAFAVLALVFASSGSATVAADARADRRGCWEYYALCTAGAFDVELWRTVCYSDYTACMGEPQPMACTDEDREFCAVARTRCENRFSMLETMEANCTTDHEVCLDAHEC